MKEYGTPGPGKGPVIFQAMTACNCGCGAKNRFVFQVGRDRVTIDEPEKVKALIAEMQLGYILLWGVNDLLNGSPETMPPEQPEQDQRNRTRRPLEPPTEEHDPEQGQDAQNPHDPKK